LELLRPTSTGSSSTTNASAGRHRGAVHRERRSVERPGRATPEVREISWIAKAALERVCSGAGLDPASNFYHPEFVDHVNDLEFHGLAGTSQSVALYTSILSELAISVEEQVVEGDRVTSRFSVTGSVYGRPVRFNGITISRISNGLITEDWSVTDTLGLLRQLGPWRSLLVGIKQWRASRRHECAWRKRIPGSGSAPSPSSTRLT
jgi:predicted ester cyclase